MHEHGFTWLQHVPILNQMPNHVAMALISAGLLIMVTFFARMSLLSAINSETALMPEPRITFRGFFEIIAEQLFGFVTGFLGHHDIQRYFPIVGALFLFIFSCNLLGMIPGVLPATDNLNTTLALGLFVFVYYNYQGIRVNGFIAHMKHFMGPVWWLAPLMFVIEIFSHVIRPISLGLRLRSNIVADHAVLGVFNDLAPTGVVLVPIIFYGFGLFVSFLQSYIFCLMTLIYISMATAHDH